MGAPVRRGRGAARAAVVAGAVSIALLALAPAALAHPLGNSTVNQYSGLRIGTDRVVVDHVLDQAEVPTLQTLIALTGHATTAGQLTNAQTDAFRRDTCARRAAALTLTVDGAAAPLAVDTAALEFPPGQGGLSTLRLTCSLSARADLRSGEHTLAFSTANDEGRLGWREITAVGDRTTLIDSPVRDASISERLRRYPADLLSSPSDQRSVTLQVRPGGAAAPAIAGDRQFGIPLRGVDVVTGRFERLVSGRFTLAVGVLGLLLSVVLGALHALSPGHGKTIMAAFLVGQRGRWKQVGVIGLTVTVTHTLGVLVLGIVLAASVTVAPQKLYPLLGAVSGLLVVGLGLGLLRTRWRSGRALVAGAHRHDDEPGTTPAAVGRGAAHFDDHDHDHDHDHAHDHGHGHDHGHDHDHGPDHDHGHAPGHDHDHAPGHDHDHAPDHAGTDRELIAAGTVAPRVGAVAPSYRQARGPAKVQPSELGPDVTVTGTADTTVIRHRHGARVHTHVVPVVTADGRVRMPSLIGMGLADGLVPSPSALVVLLGAIALGRAWFGVVLVLGYGVGMAVTLVAVGLLLGRLRGRLERGARSASPRAVAVRRALALLPVATSFVIIGVGAYLAVKGLVALRDAS